jgi:hypothetical protein
MPLIATDQEHTVLRLLAAPALESDDGVVLPAWATVTISLGGVLIGALVGLTASWLTYRGQRITQEREESMAWRDSQLEACSSMSKAWLKFRWLLYVPATAGRDLDQTEYDLIGPLGTRCAQCVARVVLLLGREDSSSAGEAAAVVDGRIARLKETAVQGGREWTPERRADLLTQIDCAEEAHECFVQTAHLAVRPEPPRRSRSRFRAG